MSLADAVADPRFHHQWVPDHVDLEKAAPFALAEALRARGHEVQFLSSGGVTQAIARQADGTLVGVHDPRVPGKAAGL